MVSVAIGDKKTQNIDFEKRQCLKILLISNQKHSNQIMIMASFRMLFVEVTIILSLLNLKSFFLFQTSCIEVFMFLKKKIILKVIEYKLRSDSYNIFSGEPDGDTS
jgi:hypothetical protein